jgi:hypothetical protein
VDREVTPAASSEFGTTINGIGPVAETFDSDDIFADTPGAMLWIMNDVNIFHMKPLLRFGRN